MKKILLSMTLLCAYEKILANNFTIHSFIHQGDACERDKSVYFVNKDVVRFMPDNYLVSFNDLVDEDDLFRNVTCYVQFNIKVEPGYQISIFQDPMFGKVKTEGDGKLTLSVQGKFIEGAIENIVLGKEMKISRQTEKRFRFDTNFPISRVFWTNCNTRELTFSQNSTFHGFKGIQQNSNVSASLDSAWVYRISSRKCL